MAALECAAVALTGRRGGRFFFTARTELAEDGRVLSFGGIDTGGMADEPRDDDQRIAELYDPDTTHQRPSTLPPWGEALQHCEPSRALNARVS